MAGRPGIAARAAGPLKPWFRRPAARAVRRFLIRAGVVAAPLWRRARVPLDFLGAQLTAVMPKGLYARALIIIITPIVILQSVVAFVFMERHWQTVTRRLSAATVRDVAAIVELLETRPAGASPDEILRVARDQLNLTVDLLPPDPLPAVRPKPFFSLLDSALSRELTSQVGKPFWIDTVGRSNLVEIRIRLDEAVLRVLARRSQTYASNSEIFILWMVGTSLVLLTIAILFLRNQIRPIQRLAQAADEFGKGRPVDDFTPRGATEVRRAAITFMEMRDRIQRMIDQRTAMLAGVSHDLRTILTRFRLQLAFFGSGPDVEALRKDVDDMQKMLEGYLAFARGDAEEETAETDMAAMLDELADEARRAGHIVTTRFAGPPAVRLRPHGFKRCLGNLVANACRHGETVSIAGTHAGGWLDIVVDDDGPGIAPEQREIVFKPFYRLDEARNLDESGTGLGLAIARDIARGHGGEITLEDGPAGGLRARVRIPA
ncbi:ATP-binding protein [Prosthecomicrobium pneumaticum]|uniref:histidine kinase n=1 Tax=Prosthecomicrobium pneumaticum TaxID=81895 RepID=A0A7W9CUV9_9HYPH|nr:ATP-binding protein [Prosthecomicrobium pneumaticum]MBB5752026.1 two-component system osmolarity sensor histidine kinase EnvZ [Prosthecomicrobium pneumaticum]